MLPRFLVYVLEFTLLLLVVTQLLLPLLLPNYFRYWWFFRPSSTIPDPSDQEDHKGEEPEQIHDKLKEKKYSDPTSEN